MQFFRASLRNFWVYNSEDLTFERPLKYLQNEHRYGYFTTAKKHYRVYENCHGERTYAAVGWGGDDAVSQSQIVMSKT